MVGDVVVGQRSYRIASGVREGRGVLVAGGNGGERGDK